MVQTGSVEKEVVARREGIVRGVKESSMGLREYHSVAKKCEKITEIHESSHGRAVSRCVSFSRGLQVAIQPTFGRCRQ